MTALRRPELWRWETLLQGLSAIRENFPQHGTDEDGVGDFAKGLKGESVVNGVYDLARGIGERVDEVAVTPQFVGAGALLVDEGDAGIDMGDVSEPSFPDERGELDLKPKHLTGENGGHLIPARAAHGEIGRGEVGEVGRIGEEIPGSGGRNREGLGLMQRMDDHKG